jgi:hypothetical protein
MLAPIIRIALRWLAGAMIAAGYLTPDNSELFGDPELVSNIAYGVGMLCGAVAEGWYALARRLGWGT